jgi:K+-transporting ATPase KdpF subunit
VRLPRGASLVITIVAGILALGLLVYLLVALLRPDTLE